MSVWHEITPISTTNPFCQETQGQTQQKKGGAWTPSLSSVQSWHWLACFERGIHNDILHSLLFLTMPPHIPSKGHDGQRATTTNQPLSNLLFRGRLLLWSIVWEATVVSSAWHEKPKTTTSGNEATRHIMAEISRTGTVLELKHFTISWSVDLFIVQHMPQVELILSCEHLWACLLREKAIKVMLPCKRNSAHISSGRPRRNPESPWRSPQKRRRSERRSNQNTTKKKRHQKRREWENQKWKMLKDMEPFERYQVECSVLKLMIRKQNKIIPKKTRHTLTIKNDNHKYTIHSISLIGTKTQTPTA